MGHYTDFDRPVEGERFDLIRNRRDHISTTYRVFDKTTQTYIGEVRQEHTSRDPEGKFCVVFGGTGVKVRRGPHKTAHEAGMAIVAAREESAATKGEALHVDDTGLAEIDRQILDFETVYPPHKFSSRGRRDAAIMDLFRIDSTRYTQMLNRLLDDPQALAYAPQTVSRLTRLRDQRRAARGGRRIAG